MDYTSLYYNRNEFKRLIDMINLQIGIYYSLPLGIEQLKLMFLIDKKTTELRKKINNLEENTKISSICQGIEIPNKKGLIYNNNDIITHSIPINKIMYIYYYYNKAKATYFYKLKLLKYNRNTIKCEIIETNNNFYCNNTLYNNIEHIEHLTKLSITKDKYNYNIGDKPTMVIKNIHILQIED